MIRNVLINNLATKVRAFFTPRSSASPGVFLLAGQLLTTNRLFLLRQSTNAVSQLWVNKANSYIGELCLDFGFSPRELSRFLATLMPTLGYTNKEQEMVSKWIRGYETGIRTAMAMSAKNNYGNHYE